MECSLQIAPTCTNPSVDAQKSHEFFCLVHLSQVFVITMICNLVGHSQSQ